jgi:hypothetical protein
MIQITTGAPMREVTALSGRAVPLPGRFTAISAARAMIAPDNIHPGMRNL